MKKKLLFVTASLLSSVTFADISTGADVAPVTRATPNVPYYITAMHSYAASNNTASPQFVAICYTTYLCLDVKDPKYRKHLYSCDTFSLQPGEYKADKKSTQLPFNYPWVGYCNVQVKTESAAWFHSIATKSGTLKVGNP